MLSRKLASVLMKNQDLPVAFYFMDDDEFFSIKLHPTIKELNGTPFLCFRISSEIKGV